ncbi:MAG: hypothetical protein WB767_08340 [Nocardioides sp.]
MRTSLAAAAALLAMAGATGCSDEPAPQRAEPTGAASPGEAPAPPLETDGTSVEEFVRHWQDEAFTMQATGETAKYREISRKCQTCSDLADAVDQIYEAGGSIRPGDVEVVDLVRVGGRQGIHILDFELRSTPTVIRDSAISEPRELPGGSEYFQVNVIQSDDQWLVTRLAQVAP